jgi:hypothetical protein
MRILTPLQALGAAAATALLTACSGTSAIAPEPSTPQGHTLPMMRSGTSVLNPIALLRLVRKAGYHGSSFNSCPTFGHLEYVSDAGDNTVNIFAGKFAGQAPCGIITGFLDPQGMIVRNQNLFVANTGGGDVEAFHRGATSPYRTYTDPTCGGEFPSDVTVSGDNTVLAADIMSNSCSGGAISSWRKSTGRLIGNFPNSAGANTYFLTIQRNKNVYYDDNLPELAVGSCPAGICGPFSNTGASFNSPGGVRTYDLEGEEAVVLDDQRGAGGGTATLYIPPSFGGGAVCPLGGGDPVGIDLNFNLSTLFYADADGSAVEFLFRDVGGLRCAFEGRVTTSGGLPVGIAVDPPESL